MEDIKILADKLLASLRKNGGVETDAYCEHSYSWEVEIRKNQLENFSNEDVYGCGVRVIDNGRVGIAFSSESIEGSIEDTIQKAKRNAINSTFDEYNGLPAVQMGDNDITDRIRRDIWDEELEKIPRKDKIDRMLDLSHRAVALDKRIREVFRASYSEKETELLIVNSNGMKNSYRERFCSSSLSLVAEENGEIQLGGDFSVKRKYRQIPFDQIASRACQRAIELLGARRVKTKEIPVVLAPMVACGFLGLISEGLCADRVQKGTSLFRDKKGGVIGPEILSVIDDGTMENEIATVPFDDEGVPTQVTPLIERGILKQFLQNSYTAKKDGLNSTGNAARASYHSMPGVGTSNFYIVNGDTPGAEIFKNIDEGLYVTDTMGMHMADPISGDFSLGVNGRWISKGELSYPVRGVSIAGNLEDILNRIECVGSDLEFYGSVGAPSLKIANFVIGGT